MIHGMGTTWPAIASRFLDLTSARRVLDVGCGDMEYDAFSGPNRIVVGVDISSIALDRARMNIQERGQSERYELVQASADRLPFRNDTFDAVTCMAAMSLFGDDRGRGLREMARVSSHLVAFNVAHRDVEDPAGSSDGPLKVRFFEEDEVKDAILAAGLKISLVKTFTEGEFWNWGLPPLFVQPVPYAEKRHGILAIARK
jgi:SAM-dependent methyltransferase